MQNECPCCAAVSAPARAARVAEAKAADWEQSATRAHDHFRELSSQTNEFADLLEIVQADNKTLCMERDLLVGDLVQACDRLDADNATIALLLRQRNILARALRQRTAERDEALNMCDSWSITYHEMKAERTAERDEWRFLVRAFVAELTNGEGKYNSDGIDALITAAQSRAATFAPDRAGQEVVE